MCFEEEAVQAAYFGIPFVTYYANKQLTLDEKVKLPAIECIFALKSYGEK